MTRFVATAVGYVELTEDEDGINAAVLVLAEKEKGGLRLELQKALEYDEQDVALGMDTYCLCTERGDCCYGGVKAWRLSADSFEIELDDRAAAILETPGFQICFPADQRSQLAQRVEAILGAPSQSAR